MSAALFAGRVTVSDFVTCRATLADEMLVEDVERWFHAEVASEAAVVVDTAGGIVGVVFRRRFLHSLSGRFGHALFGSRPIAELMETDFLAVPAATELTDVAGYLSLRKNEHFYDDVVVTFPDGSFGTAPVRAILEALQDASLRLHDDLESIRAQNRQLQNQSETRWEMISSLSHELKTPLSTISGYAELAELQMEDRAKALACIQKIRDAAGEMLGYVNSVLEMARASAGRLELQPERFDFRTEVEAAAAQLEVLTRGRPIRVAYQVPAEPVWVFLDKRKARQVIVNLIGNAAKFTHHGAISLRLRKEERAVLEVADTGPGIEEDKIPHLFQRFERVGDRTIDGSGLGLSIVKALVEAQGGSVGVSSVVNQGTTFFIHYPLWGEAAV